MKRLTLLLISSFSFILFFSTSSTAQCPVTNSAFESGERLEYKLFFNWKFIWKKAGTATMTTKSTTYKGTPAFQTDLITRTEKIVDKWFCMRDTLCSIYSTNIVPLYYRKGANEGGKYRLNEINYSYSDGQTKLHQYYRHSNGNVVVTDNTAVGCAYDMISMMMQARSYHSKDFTVGQRIPFFFADGDKVKQEFLIYRGIKNFTTEGTNITYRCLVFSYMEKSKKKEKEVVKFYITDDENHIPVRLDLNLRFGTAKAYLTRATGLRNPETSIVKK
ncbi:MAG: DUF3108 domain-containing protein [Bacteroidaceae bacterium]|nr:DUF3108 domain-containing protein [Bacteroidaceae bacterium]